MSGISIHAPAKGATGEIPTVFHRKNNFNPRSREGSDPNGYTLVHINTYFNPRSREGSDEPTFSKISPICRISIHAPAKGATRELEEYLPTICNFNPRSREGSDISSSYFLRYSRQFQSTLPRRERLRSVLELFLSHMISIHAPAKGATSSLPQKTRGNKISIHAPAKGATAFKFCFQAIPIISIHAPAKGATKINSDLLPDKLMISIHAPAKGATHISGDCRTYPDDFNPRSREGSDVLIREYGRI